MKLDRNAGIDEAREFYRKQHPLRCALFGHKMLGVLVDHSKIECARCGGLWHFGDFPSPSLYDWFVRRPIGPIRRRIGNWKYARWHKRFFSKPL